MPRIEAQAELKKTKNLEYTVFHNGFFSDYYGMPNIKSYLTPFTLIMDAQNNVAGIPGSGDNPVVFTRSSDVAKFVAASLDLDKWDPVFTIIGDRVTWNDVLKLVEAAKGTFITAFRHP
jgi:hypothetical protein